MARLLSAFIISILLFFTSHANSQTKWEVIDAKSNLSFSVNISGSEVGGTFEKWSAKIFYNPEDIKQAKIIVNIDMNSVTISNLQVFSLIKTAEWLNVDDYSNARFIGNGFNFTADKMLSMQGMLSLKGVDIPVHLIGDIALENDMATASFTTTLQRNNYKIGNNNPAVMNDVIVKAKISASKISN